MSTGGLFYHSGIEAYTTWLTTPKVWLLMGNAGAYNEDDDVIADIEEVAIGGYARQAFVAPVNADHKYPGYLWRTHGGDAPVFPTMDPGEFCVGLVLANNTGDDATSQLLAFWPMGVSTSVGDIVIDFQPWEATDGTGDLPGGTDSTRRMITTYASRM